MGDMSGIPDKWEEISENHGHQRTPWGIYIYIYMSLPAGEVLYLKF
jgi:hypothetical protein